MMHHLTATVTVQVDLQVPTDIGPLEVAKQVDAGAHNFLSGMKNHNGQVRVNELTTTVGAWHLANDDGTFEGKIG